MTGSALVQGASRGVGRALVEALLARGIPVVATCRDPSALDDLASPGLQVLRVDATDEASIAAAGAALRAQGVELDLVINAAGLLHDGDLRPERRLEDLNPAHLTRLFAVNTVGPLLVARHVVDRMRHGRRAVFASLSARVGSIEDNRLGGWYGYRMSKAALNQATRTLAVELGRRAPAVIAVALHPGTVATDLSAPFRRHVPPRNLHTPTAAAAHLLAVCDGLTEADSGGFFAWDGAKIPW